MKRTKKPTKARPSWAIAYAKQTWPNQIGRRLTALNKSAREVDHLNHAQKVEARWLAAAIRSIAIALEEATEL